MSRMKKFRNKMGQQVIAGKISRAEALRRIDWEARRKDARPAVTKTTKTGAVKQQQAFSTMEMRHADQILRAANAELRDPVLRESIRPGGGAG